VAALWRAEEPRVQILWELPRDVRRNRRGELRPDESLRPPIKHLDHDAGDRSRGNQGEKLLRCARARGRTRRREGLGPGGRAVNVAARGFSER
jgi:hypothetical protein